MQNSEHALYLYQALVTVRFAKFSFLLFGN